jgi:hypothetical protein
MSRLIREIPQQDTSIITIKEVMRGSKLYFYAIRCDKNRKYTEQIDSSSKIHLLENKLRKKGYSL